MFSLFVFIILFIFFIAICGVGYGAWTLIGILSIIFSLMVYLCAIPEGKIEVDSETDIYSLGLVSGVHDSFVLGGGHVDSFPVFYYVVKGEYGYQVKNTDPHDNIYIKYSNRAPRLVNYCTSSYMTMWTFSIGDTCHKVMYVPFSTVKKVYSIDVSKM